MHEASSDSLSKQLSRLLHSLATHLNGDTATEQQAAFPKAVVLPNAVQRKVEMIAGPLTIQALGSHEYAAGYASVNIGETVTLQVRCAIPDVEYRIYLQHGFVIDPMPLIEWTQDEQLPFWAESPDLYHFHFQWRSKNPQGVEQQGWQTFALHVRAEGLLSPAPVQVRSGGNVPLWLPTGWEAAVYQDHEAHVMAWMESVIQPGWTVYDVGANLGAHAIPMSRMVGPAGHVYGFEINPICIYYLQMNLLANAVANCSVIPVAVSDQAGPVSIRLNYGNRGIGTVESSPLYTTKWGQRITVEGDRLDSMIARLDLPAPDFIKIDIEGAEAFAMRGMTEILQRHRPIFLIEVHGVEAASETLAQLDPYRYDFINLNTGARHGSSGEYMAAFTDLVTQVACIPRA
jgi:FkbM family methyltransferase